MKKSIALILFGLMVLGMNSLSAFAMEENIQKNFEQYKERFEKFSAQLDERAEHLEEDATNLRESGIDIPNLEQRIGVFKENFGNAKENFRLAVDYFKQAEEIRNNNPDDNEKKEAKELYQYAKQYYREAVADVRQAVGVYKRVVRDIRAAGGLNWDANAPDFTAGEDLGFFLWRDGGRKYVCMSGDGSDHQYKGRIVSEGPMNHVYSYHWDSRDDYRIEGNTLTFSGHVNPHMDCLGFRNRGGVKMELFMDDGDDPTIIHLGAEKENPDANVFDFAAWRTDAPTDFSDVKKVNKFDFTSRKKITPNEVPLGISRE